MPRTIPGILLLPLHHDPISRRCSESNLFFFVEYSERLRWKAQRKRKRDHSICRWSWPLLGWSFRTQRSRWPTGWCCSTIMSVFIFTGHRIGLPEKNGIWRCSVVSWFSVCTFFRVCKQTILWFFYIQNVCQLVAYVFPPARLKSFSLQIASGIFSQLMQEFNMSQKLGVLTLSLFVCGYCVGWEILWRCFIFAVLTNSDHYFGVLCQNSMVADPYLSTPSSFSWWVRVFVYFFFDKASCVSRTHLNLSASWLEGH